VRGREGRDRDIGYIGRREGGNRGDRGDRVGWKI